MIPLQKELRLGINGFGRIGRCILRLIAKHPDFQAGKLVVTQINDLTDAKTLAHLLKYDSVHGPFDQPVVAEGNRLRIGDHLIPVTAEPKPEKLDWASSSTSLVLECTGRFKNREEVAQHLKAGAKRVIVSAPLKGADRTIVFGINEKEIDLEKDLVLSNASCTTNCLAPVAKVIHESFGIVRGSMTTVHSYTNDQRILDLPHSDLRRARAAAVSMIPTTTGAAKAVALVLPELKGRLDGMAVRVPTPNVSLVDLNVLVEKKASPEQVNEKLEAAANGPLKNILFVSREELVSIDYRGRSESSLVDAPFTAVVDDYFVKVLSWYDNEWGFSARMLDLSCYLGSHS
ncbi:MAG: type I glyceraldehyde-3-phosphate dehydrogenase [Bradymonadales bacterium]|nr:MAG: type I glyceraldehyde-3-phosphate dehydrogenase [Bradymonadales bacterium]